MSTQRFLFDPIAVSHLLDGLPHLRAALADPHQEGEPSTGRLKRGQVADIDIDSDDLDGELEECPANYVWNIPELVTTSSTAVTIGPTFS
jgi:hypothetical protein